MGFSEHQDNLSLKHLERQERKDVIEKKLLKEIKTEEMKTYGEILKTLRPDQIGMLIKKKYYNDLKQHYIPYPQLQKDYAYNFLVQTALSMLGGSTDIDADYGPKTKTAVQAFQSKYGLTPDGQVGPAVLEKFVDLLHADTKPVAEIKKIEKKEVHSQNNKNNEKIETDISIAGIFSGPLKKYEFIKNEFISFTQEEGLKSNEIKLLAQIIHAENPLYKKHRRNYTPIGQVGRAAREDGYKFLGKEPPNRNKSNIKQQLTACYGYAGFCGVFNASNQYELGIAFAKYNLGPNHKPNSQNTMKSFRNQAPEMQKYAKQYASNQGKNINYDAIVYAEHKYYTTEKDV